MRTYQRLVIARGGSELGTNNPAYPHNFLITNSATGTLKIGSTGTRYNSLQEVGSTPQTFVPTETTPVVSDTLVPETTEMNVEQVVWPPKKKATRKKKSMVNDSEVVSNDND